MMPPLDHLRLQRGAAQLHALGPRAVAELLAELAQHIGGTAVVLDRLAAYGRLTPAMMAAAGANHAPARPMRAVSP